MPGTFQERMDELKRLVGGPETITMSNTVDQVYAFNIHEGYWLNFMGRFGPKSLHVHNGESHFLRNALYAGSPGFLQRVAQELLDTGTLRSMIVNAEQLVLMTAARTPVEFGDLAESGHGKVMEGGRIVWDQPPIIPRLSRTTLGAKAKKLAKGDMHRTYLPPNHQRHGTIHRRNVFGHPRHPAHTRAPFELP